MPYYHVYIGYTDKKGKRTGFFTFGLSEAHVKERIVAPYLKNKAFMFSGIIVHPSDIEPIYIFRSKEGYAKNIILPNGKSALGEENEYIINCFLTEQVKGVSDCTDDFITLPPEEKEELKTPELTIDLMESATFLGLDTNWSLATCALQLQEVAVTLVAKKNKIKLDKANVERLLNREIEDLSFNDKYKAFSRQVKDSFDVEMPILTTDLRRMRTRVLHKGYNPKPEETESIASFTIGLLKKLKDIS